MATGFFVGAGSGSTTSGGDKYYQHTQNNAVPVWYVAHNLNKKPTVTTFDNEGNTLYGKTTYLDNNNLKITFSNNISGIAIIN